MKFQIDHDLHLHSQLSSCSRDPEQTPQAILAYAQANGLTHICLTDHFWDEKVPGASNWYQPQNLAHIREALPLPQADGVRFSFGAETDMDRFFTIGVARETLDQLDFLIVPTTHLHMGGFTIDADAGCDERARLYVARLEALLDADLPFRKVGIAHLTCSLMYSGGNKHLDVLARVSDADFLRLFRRAAALGCGVELNFPIGHYQGEAREAVLRPYRLAKQADCRFYLGSDAHTPAELAGAMANFRQIVDALDLREEEKFTF